MKDKVVISVNNLGKKYAIGATKKEETFRSAISLKKIFGAKSTDEFWAVSNLDFKVSQGEVVGIIGKNGAGKSTLLKILSQITRPSTGKIEIKGRVASLLEVGTGFHPELTGRENIYLNGTILGMSRKEVQVKLDEIIAFSGIEKFIDTPVKHYSSGMYVRLAFSVAAHLEPEILIIDEVLAVGDIEFQRKCLGKMQDVASAGRTVLFVSHNLSAVRSLCTRGILIRKGGIVFDGEVDAALNEYINDGEHSATYTPTNIKSDLEVCFKRIDVHNAAGDLTDKFEVSNDIFLRFEFEQKSENHPFSLFVIIKNQYGEPVFSAEQKIDNAVLTLEVSKMFLTRGQYHIHAFIHIPQVKQYDIAEDVCQFAVEDSSSAFAIHGDYNYGSVFGNYKWK